VCPGFTKTTLLGPLLEDEGAEKLKEIEASQPFGGIGKPEDIAKVAVFLASEDAAWVTGIPLPVDGGYLAR
jgi:NAD(P)-dependent dehydrogenase (short-subunit alcohol dehydrogenase family)